MARRQAEDADMNRDKLLGQVQAIHEKTQESAETLRDSAEQHQRIQSRAERMVAELEELRELKFAIEDLVAEARSPSWLTTPELARELKISVRTLRDLYRNGTIRGHRLTERGQIRFDREEVREDVRRLGL
jgi:excisionase family DNA binding protein